MRVASGSTQAAHSWAWLPTSASRAADGGRRSTVAGWLPHRLRHRRRPHGVVANGEATQPAIELHLLDLRNNVDIKLTNTKDVDDDQPTWLSDRQVVFVRDDRLWRLDMISTIARQLTGPAGSPGNAAASTATRASAT
jgi:hypothetical protein